MKKSDNDAAPIPLEQPRTGGSFVRQEDGSLKMVEGAIAADAPAAEAEPVADPAPTPEPPADAGASVTEQHEG